MNKQQVLKVLVEEYRTAELVAENKPDRRIQEEFYCKGICCIASKLHLYDALQKGLNETYNSTEEC